MGRKPFQFKHFTLTQENSALGINTDSCIFGAMINLNKPKNVLDVGCGNGVIIRFLNQKWPNTHYTGIDNHSGSVTDAINNTKNLQNVLILDRDLFTFNSEIKFDNIVSNPPFFFDDLKSHNQQKNQSKHWSKKHFSKYLNRLKDWILPKGSLWILLPYNHNTQPDLIINEGWHIIQEIVIQPRENKPAHLRIYELSLTDNSDNPIQSKFVVYDINDSFSEPIFNKLKDYYLEQALYVKNKT